MKEVIIKIKFDDEGGYKGHGDDTAKLIVQGLERYMEIDLEGDRVVKNGWVVELVRAINTT